MSEPWVPQLAPVADLRTLRLTPHEAFVLSRVDGRASCDEIAAVIGLSREEARALLTELVNKGALVDPAPAPAAPPEEPPSDDTAGEEADAAPAPAEEEARARSQASADAVSRKRYVERFARAATAARVQDAGVAEGDDLLALCFDPEPAVIRAVLASERAGAEHARLVALHHRTAAGLEAALARPEWARDRQVQRNLLRNPLSGEPLIARLFASKRLAELHRLAIDPDYPERTRLLARGTLRSRFNVTAAEEKAALVFATEGRVLTLLAGLTFDARTTALLCGKVYTSILLVQNLARFPAAPPAVLAHLLRQALVKRQPQLRQSILQHPNTPADAKRRA